MRIPENPTKLPPAALAALGDHSQFLIWRYEPQRIASNGETYPAGKFRKAGYSDPLIEKLPINKTVKAVKAPINPATLNYGNALEPNNWLSAAEVFARAIELNQDNGDGTQPYGVGFVLTAADDFFCLDVDDCAVEGGWSELAKELWKSLPGCAVEVSYSGNGLHLWGTYGGSAPDHRSKNTKLHIELYTQERFIALGRPDVIGNAATDCTQNLRAVIGRYFADGEANGAGGDWRTNWERLKAAGVNSNWNGPADDDELIAKAVAFKNPSEVFDNGKVAFTNLWTADAEKIAECWPGNHDGYDASSADASLAFRLAFWTGKDAARIHRLMLASDLRRDKWTEREDYLPRTIVSACDKCERTYNQDYYKPANSAETVTQTQPGVMPGLGELTKPGEIDVAKAIRNGHAGAHCFSVDFGHWYSREPGKLWKVDKRAAWLHELISAYMEEYGLKRGNSVTGVEKFLRAYLADRGQWDEEPNLCGLPDDQVLNLVTGQVQPAKVTDRISRRLGAIPKQGTPARWLQFLAETMPINESAAYISWLQVWFGYVLTGHTRERRFVFMSGSGGNGKSVLLDTLAAVMGDYAVTLQSAVLFGERQDHAEWKTKLDGPRLASVAEVSLGVKWKTVDLKEFTGGTWATIAARPMRQDTYNFSPTAKIIIVGNDRPDLVTVDNAIRDRIILLELDRRPARPDKQLIETLRNEHGKILAWMVEGAQKYLRDSLPDIPASAKAATAEYLSNEDQFAPIHR